MCAFDDIALKNQKWDSEIVAYIAAIHEAKGKQELYLKYTPHSPHLRLMRRRLRWRRSAGNFALRSGQGKSIRSFSSPYSFMIFCAFIRFRAVTGV